MDFRRIDKNTVQCILSEEEIDVVKRVRNAKV